MPAPYLDEYKDEILDLWESGEFKDRTKLAKYVYHSFTEISINRSEDGFRRTLYDALNRWQADREIIKENVQYKKETQKARDSNRISNKSFREYARIENALEEYNKSLIEVLKKDGLSLDTIKHKEPKLSAKGIIHLSDTHFNELVDISSNKYDFKIASERLKSFSNDIKLYCKAFGIKECVLAFGGDLLNSDRRLDEMLSMATNRAKATQLSIRLLKYFIQDINTFTNLHCVGVTGNESRAKQELGWSDITATDSYDFTIYDCLRIIYEGKKGIRFTPMSANEVIFTLNNKKFLLIHGHQLKGDIQKSVQGVIGKYVAKGITVDYVLAGHIHSAYISDYFSRNASLTGSNAYSEEALNFVSRASQNFHIIHEHNKIDSVKCDLQNTNDIDGYPIENDVDAYNAKSVSKSKNTQVVFQIVI